MSSLSALDLHCSGNVVEAWEKSIVGAGSTVVRGIWSSPPIFLGSFLSTTLLCLFLRQGKEKSSITPRTVSNQPMLLHVLIDLGRWVRKYYFVVSSILSDPRLLPLLGFVSGLWFRHFTMKMTSANFPPHNRAV